MKIVDIMRQNRVSNISVSNYVNWENCGEQFSNMYNRNRQHMISIVDMIHDTIRLEKVNSKDDCS